LSLYKTVRFVSTQVNMSSFKSFGENIALRVTYTRENGVKEIVTKVFDIGFHLYCAVHEMFCDNQDIQLYNCRFENAVGEDETLTFENGEPVLLDMLPCTDLDDPNEEKINYEGEILSIIDLYIIRDY